MAKVRSRLLVIDASIAMAAGDVSMNPTSRNCREFLQTILQICHLMALTVPIQEEWNRHQSRFARQWRKLMMARKKIELVEVPPERSLERRIIRTIRDAPIAAIIEKDRRLIEAALVTDKRVASLDDQVRGHFKAHRDTLPEARSICWVNPNTPDEEIVAWLRSGAPSDPFRALGHTPREAER